MKKTYIVIALATILVFGSFTAGFFLFQKADTESFLPIEWAIECSPDARMMQSTWMTYVDNNLGFSIEYPNALIPTRWKALPLVLFRTKAESNSNILLGADISISSLPVTNVSGVSGISEYRCSPIKFGGAVRANANIYHASKVYRISVVGMSFQDVERMVGSIKFLE